MSNQFLDKSGLKQFWIRIAARLAGKVDKVAGKDLSSNDYTNEDKSKVQTMKAAAAKNVDSFIVSASTSENLPTSKAVASFVENKGYKTTDNNTTYTIIQNETNGRMLTLRGSDGTSQTVTIPDSIPIVDLSTLGIENVKNIDQSKAIKTIRRDGTTFIYTCLDGTTGTFTQQDNNTWVAMAGATSDSNGRAGYVPAPPSSGYNTKYLRADGTWTIPPNTNTQYTLTQDTSDRHKFIFAGTDGTNVSVTIPDNNTTYTISQDPADGHKLILTGSDGTSKAVTIPDIDTTYTLQSLGIGNVKNYDQSKAIKSITRDGTTFTYTCLDGTTGTFTQQDNDTTYTLESLGIGNIKNYDQSKAIKSITRDGNTFTYTCLDGTTGTFTQKDDNTWIAMVGATSSANGTAGYVPAPPSSGYNTKYLRADGTWTIPPNDNTTNTAGSTSSTDKLYLIGAKSMAASVQTYARQNVYIGADGYLYSNASKVLAENLLKSTEKLSYPAVAGDITPGRIYPVTIDSNGYLSVNVPWISSASSFTGGNGILIAGTEISNSGVLGVKGDKESNYRKGNVNITPSNIGAMPETPSHIELSGDTPYIDFHYGQSSSDYTARIIADALGYLAIEGGFEVRGNLVVTGGNLNAQAATQSLNGLMSSEDKTKLDGLSSSVATTSLKGLMSAADKRKLDGLSSDIATTSTNGLMSSEDKAKLDGLSSSVATSTSKGLMSATDKRKLDGLSSDVATTSTNGLMSAEDKTKLDGLSSDIATTSTNGLMSSEDKAKLDGLSSSVATSTSKGLMSATDKRKLDGLSSDVATTSTNGLMSAEDKTKLNSLRNSTLKTASYIYDREIPADESERIYTHTVENANVSGMTIYGLSVINTGTLPKNGPIAFIDGNNLKIRYTHGGGNSSAVTYSFTINVIYE